MSTASLCAVGVVACLLTVLIKQYKPEMSLLLTIACSLILSIAVIEWLSPLIVKISSLASKYEMKDDLGVLIKSVGICFLTQSAADTCRDAQCTSIAGKIETAGKIAVLVAVFPLFEKILQYALNIMDG